MGHPRWLKVVLILGFWETEFRSGTVSLFREENTCSFERETCEVENLFIYQNTFLATAKSLVFFEGLLRMPSQTRNGRLLCLQTIFVSPDFEVNRE